MSAEPCIDLTLKTIMKVQAVELPGTRESGYSGVYRNADFQSELATTCSPDVIL